MAPEPAPPSRLLEATLQLLSLARGCPDRLWQRRLLELATACSAYAKAPASEERTRVLTRARALVSEAVQAGEDATAAAAWAIVGALAAAGPSGPASPVAAMPTVRAPIGSAPLTNPPAAGVAGSSPSTEPLSLDPRAAAAPLDRPAAQAAAARFDRLLDTGDGKITEPLTPDGPREGEDLVFVIDSDPESRRVMAKYFRAAGFRVVVFDDGTPVIARAREERPSLIVAELLLPVMPGEVLIVALRRSPATAAIPILVVTHEPWRLGPEHEVEGVLTKPVNVNVVVEAARRLLSSAAGTDSLRVTRI